MKYFVLLVAAVVRCCLWKGRVFMWYELLPVHTSYRYNSPKAYAVSIICKGESLVKAVNFHNILEHKTNELHINSDVGSYLYVSWYLPSIQEKAVKLLGIHKEMKSLYWLLTDNFSCALCINSCLINSSGTNWAIDLVDPRLFDLIIRKSLSV